MSSPRPMRPCPYIFFLASGLPFSFVLRGVVVPPKSKEKERFLELLVAAADDTNYGCHFRVGTSVRCCDHVACLFWEVTTADYSILRAAWLAEQQIPRRCRVYNLGRRPARPCLPVLCCMSILEAQKVSGLVICFLPPPLMLKKEVSLQCSRT